MGSLVARGWHFGTVHSFVSVRACVCTRAYVAWQRTRSATQTHKAAAAATPPPACSISSSPTCPATLYMCSDVCAHQICIRNHSRLNATHPLEIMLNKQWQTMGQNYYRSKHKTYYASDTIQSSGCGIRFAHKWIRITNVAIRCDKTAMYNCEID